MKPNQNIIGKHSIVDHTGVEPVLPECKTGVFPLSPAAHGQLVTLVHIVQSYKNNKRWWSTYKSQEYSPLENQNKCIHSAQCWTRTSDLLFVRKAF